MTITINGTTGIAGVDGSAGTPAVQGTDTNTGIYFGSDTISFAEGGAEAVQIDSSANLKFNSGYGSVATAYGCRAWVNFNGTGTVAIRASGNVSSITDNGVGQYTVNLTNAMPDTNYAIQLAVAGTGSYADWSRSQWYLQSTVSTTGFQVNNVDEADSYFDTNSFSVSVFR